MISEPQVNPSVPPMELPDPSARPEQLVQTILSRPSPSSLVVPSLSLVALGFWENALTSDLPNFTVPGIGIGW